MNRQAQGQRTTAHLAPHPHQRIHRLGFEMMHRRRVIDLAFFKHCLRYGLRPIAVRRSSSHGRSCGRCRNSRRCRDRSCCRHFSRSARSRHPGRGWHRIPWRIAHRLRVAWRNHAWLHRITWRVAHWLRVALRITRGNHARLHRIPGRIAHRLGHASRWRWHLIRSWRRRCLVRRCLLGVHERLKRILSARLTSPSHERQEAF